MDWMDVDGYLHWRDPTVFVTAAARENAIEWTPIAIIGKGTGGDKV
jgi:hypothetical protein